MQLQLSFLETPLPAVAPVWATLDDKQRAEVLAALARLIAKAVDIRSEERVASAGEKNDE